MYRRSLIKLIPLALLFSFTGCSNLDNDTLAHVPAQGNAEEWTLDSDTFREICIGRWGNAENAAKRTDEERVELLEDVVLRHLKSVDGFHKGLDQDPGVVTEYESTLDRAAISELYRIEVRDKVVTDEDVHDFYEHDKEEIQASHILLNSENYDDAAAEKLLNELRTQLVDHGADFKELAKKYGEDTSTPDGSLNWFRWGMMVQSFQEAAFALQLGEISQPVKTRYGWHLISLEGRRKLKDLKSFEDSEELIRRQVLKLKADDLRKDAEIYINRLRDGRGYSFDEKVAAKIMTALAAVPGGMNAGTALSVEDQALVIATLDNDEIKLTFADLAASYGNRMPPISSTADLDMSVQQYIAKEFLLADDARSKGLYDSEDIKSIANASRDRKIMQIAQRMIINDKATPDEKAVLAYYENNNDKYLTDVEFTIVEILVKDEELANELVTRINGGENMRELASKYTERKITKEKQGVLGPIKESQYSEVGKEAAKAEIGELVGPFQMRSNKKWSILKVISKGEADLKPFESVKKKVANDAKLDLRRSLETNWSDSLRAAIPYSINKKAANDLFSDIKKMKSDVDNDPKESH